MKLVPLQLIKSHCHHFPMVLIIAGINFLILCVFLGVWAVQLIAFTVVLIAQGSWWAGTASARTGARVADEFAGDTPPRDVIHDRVRQAARAFGRKLTEDVPR